MLERGMPGLATKQMKVRCWLRAPASMRRRAG
jgi:hypothetical protein